MHWPAALFAIAIWMFAASFWQFYRPMPEQATHREASAQIFRDIAPAILIGLLVGMVLD